MKTQAAVLFETNKLEVVDLDIPKIKSGQVLVDIFFSGVCGTQIGEIRGLRGKDEYLPHCLGHEGSGIVREVSEGVTHVEPGDNVILSWIKDQGANVNSTIYDYNGKKINAGGVTTFQKYAVVSENRLTKLPQNSPMGRAALLGCPIPTGMGSVMVVAGCHTSSIIIFGAGGVGLSAVIAAKQMNCKPITVVDPVKWKLDIAKRLGANLTVNTSDNLCITDYDFAIETSGKQNAIYNAMQSVKSQGGIVVIVGNSRFGTELKINPHWFNQGKELRGCWGGNATPYDFLKMVDCEDLDLLTKDRYSLTDINKAVNDLENGRVIRPLIDMSL